MERRKSVKKQAFLNRTFIYQTELLLITVNFLIFFNKYAYCISSGFQLSENHTLIVRISKFITKSLKKSISLAFDFHNYLNRFYTSSFQPRFGQLQICEPLVTEQDRTL